MSYKCYLITDSINHNFARIRNDSYNSVAVEKTLTFYNVIILIKSKKIYVKINLIQNIFK